MIDVNKPRVLITLGNSPEREISIKSTAYISALLEGLGHQTAILDLATGRFHQIPELENLVADHNDLPEASDIPLTDIKRHFEVVFIAGHGSGSEDGVIQNFLEASSVSFVGTKSSGSSASLDKSIAKILLKNAGVLTPEWQTITKLVEMKMQYPVVVKPLNLGSSIGISICENEAEFKIGFQSAQEYSAKVLVEQFVKGTEISVGVYEKTKGQIETLPIAQITPRASFFDYKAKYEEATDVTIPARLTPEVEKLVQETALATFKALDCRHLARTDMIVDNSGKVYVLEQNTIPFLTQESVFSLELKAAQIQPAEFIANLIKLAIEE